MEEDLRLELFTVAEVRDWLVHNRSVRGLSDQLIAKTRAWAIVNNPYADDDLNIISAIFVNDEVAAFTYLFPDEVNGKRIFWNTVLYCSPKFEGRGYAAIVIGQFVELYGEKYFDLDAVQESIENLKFNGLTVEYVDQYYLSRKIITRKTIKASLARLIERFVFLIQNRVDSLKKVIASTDYSLTYVSYVDDETYAFIRNHSKGDMFLRSQEMFNWILTYPFMQSSPLLSRVQEKCAFGSRRLQFQYHAVQVRKNNQLVGFYILNHSAEVLYLNYLYMDDTNKAEVFASIAEHILNFNAPKFFTANKCLADYVAQYHLYPKYRVMHKSFAYPDGFVYDKTKFIQAGDGDNIT